MVPAHLRDDRIQFRLRPGGRISRLQSRDDLHKVTAALVRVSFKREWRPDIHRMAVRHAVIAIAGMFRTGGHYANHGVRLRIQSDLAAYDARVGCETRAPQTVGQNHDLAVAGSFFAGVELAAYGGIGFVGFYLSGAAILSFLAVLAMPETADR